MVDRSSPPQGLTFIGAGFDTWAGSPFVQSRLALLGKTVFLLAFGFFTVMNGMLVLGGGLSIVPALVTQANVMHFLAAMVMLACCVSLRFFRFGGITKMVLGGIAAGFLLYVLSKVTEDLSKAELLHPAAAAWLPVLAGGLTGFIVLLYQEDG